MKNVIRFICLAIALVLVLGIFAACKEKETTGTDQKSTDEAKESAADTSGSKVEGEIQTWGIFTVLVPAGMKLKGGDMFNADASDAFTVSLLSDETHQLRVSVVSEDDAVSGIETTKELNASSDPKDVEFKTGDVTWKGVAYVYGGTSDCFQVYGEIDGRFVLVGSSYLAYDAEEVTAVLSSIVLAPAESAD